MNRAAKIALGASLAGLMLAVAIASALRPSAPDQRASVAVSPSESQTADPDLHRCRTITMPDAGCEAAWEARHRHFFGSDDRR
ncbi:MAG: putative entry exclusion protein TrbK-alt [Novosphingobium sp.]|nr:putative entry exclusion protein TrbK-alt [Novosphingobium sp.]